MESLKTEKNVYCFTGPNSLGTIDLHKLPAGKKENFFLFLYQFNKQIYLIKKTY